MPASSGRPSPGNLQKKPEERMMFFKEGEEVIMRSMRSKQKHKKQHKETNKQTTLPETNIAPKDGWLEYYFPIGEAYFQVLC